VPFAQIGGLPMKLMPKVFDFTMDTPRLAGKHLVRAMHTGFAKSAKNDLKPTDFLEHNFYILKWREYGKFT
jgi:hypothetical protein